MPTFTDPDFEACEKITKNGGVEEETIKTRERYMKHFDTFAKQNYSTTLSTLSKNKRKANLKMVISMLKSFFQAYRVKVPGGKKEELPKRATIEAVKSHLKKGLFLLSEGRIDLDSKDFLDFEDFFSGYCKLLKSEGRGDTQSHPEIPQSSWDKIMEHIFILQQLMECMECGEKGSPQYFELVKKLPVRYQNKYHYLLQWGGMMILMSFTAKRGREKMGKLEWSHFKKLYNEEGGFYYYAQIKKLSSKNHKKDNQRFSGQEGRGGVFPFEVDDYGINPGRYLELFAKLQDPENPLVCQHPVQPSSSWNIHDPNVKKLFNNEECGKNFISQMLPQLSKALGIPHLTNCQVRCSSIRRMKRGNASDREVMEVSEHVSVVTLNKYAPDATLEKRMAMARSINKKKPQLQAPQLTENVPLVQERIDLGSGINIPRFEEFVCSVCFDVFYRENLLLRHITSNHKELLNMARKRPASVLTPSNEASSSEKLQTEASPSKKTQKDASLSENLQNKASLPENHEKEAPLSETPQNEASLSESPQNEASLSENHQNEASMTESPQNEASLSENLENEASLSENPPKEASMSNTTDDRITSESVAKSFSSIVGPMFTQEVKAVFENTFQEVEVKKFKFKSKKPIFAMNESMPDDPFNTSFLNLEDFDEIEAQATSITFEDHASNKGTETKIAPVKVVPVKDAPTKDAPAQNSIKDTPVTKLVTEKISTQIVKANNDDNNIVARKKATIDAQLLQLKVQRAMNINLFGRLIENEQKIAMQSD